MQTFPLNYVFDSYEYFRKVYHLDGAIWLDSCFQGEFDIICALPITTLIGTPENLYIYQEGSIVSSAPISCMEQEIQQQLSRLSHVPSCEELPFIGGVAGYFNYEANHHFLLPHVELPPKHLLFALGLYTWSIIIDHKRNKATFVATAECKDSKIKLMMSLLLAPSKKIIDFSLSRNFKAELNKVEYTRSTQSIINSISNGDCYQVNYAQRFNASICGDPLSAYSKLRKKGGPYSAYINLGKKVLLSASPEQFIKVRSGVVETRPIKGTVPRQTCPEKDELAAEWLKNSEKNRAENLMIVDLLRNDLSKNSHPFSVKVTELYSLLSLKNVHHLVSVIQSRILDDVSTIKLFLDAFPGGSITGAPKIMAMQMIHDLENTSRSSFCGSIGYFSRCGNVDTNINIRSLEIDKPSTNGNMEISCWGGGGIVYDSTPDTEYQESLDKIKPFMNLLNL